MLSLKAHFNASIIHAVHLHRVTPVMRSHLTSLPARAGANLTRASAILNRHVQGLSDVAHRYDAILLDQFGVLHDGKQVCFYMKQT